MKKNMRDETITAAKERDYWLGKLSGEPVKSVFPYDHGETGDKTYRGRTVTFKCPENVSVKLIELGGGSDHLLHMVLTSGLLVLLNGYTHSDDLLVGTTVPKQAKDTAFVNTVLPLRVRVDTHAAFKQLLLRVRETLVEAVEHQNYSVNRVGSSLFDIAVLLENIHDRRYLGRITPNILLSFSREGREISGEVEYNSNLYEHETVERMAVNFKHVLEQVADNVDLPVSDVDILSPEEKQKILYEFNHTGAPYPKNRTVHDLFVKQACSSPGDDAVIYGDTRLSYGDLDRESSRLARLLGEMGVRPGVPAALLLDWCVEIVVGIMAVLRTGGAYLPLDPRYPEKRIERILKDSNARVLITSKDLAHKRGTFEGEVIRIEDVTGTGDSPGRAFITSPHDPAYIIYTSGSTGDPKGIVVEHHSFIDFVTWAVDEFGHRPGFRVLLSNSYASDGSIQQIFPPLVSGGALYLLDPDVRLYARAYYTFLKENRINCIDEVPVVMNLLFSGLDLDETVELLPDLTSLSLGSEYVPMDVVKKCRKYLNHNGKIINAYGPAEASVETCTYFFDGRSETEVSLIGKPRRNLEVYILDPRGRHCPIGVPGEICIGGIGLARGYINKPELTAAAFNRSYRSDKTHIFYKTGDRGRWMPGGPSARGTCNIEFLGRIGYQVQLRGSRIELGEIEARLLDIDGIKDAVVVVRSDDAGDKFLCAYFVSDRKYREPEPRETLSRKLPDIMIPSYFVQLQTMPLNPNGKVDRNALPNPVTAVPDDGYAAPRDALEQRLADTWASVLNLPSRAVGIDSNFFRLGGHSLKAGQLISKIDKEFNIKMPLTRLFRAPTIRESAEYIRNTAETTFISIKEAERREYYPASSSQKRLFIVQQLNRADTAYNLPAGMIIEGPTDRKRLQSTLEQLVRRHESLRTGFETRGGEIVQRVYEHPGFKLAYYETDARAETPEERNELIEKIIKGDVRLRPSQVETPIPALEKREYYEASHAQKQVWVVCQFEGGSEAFNMPGGCILEGDLDERIVDKVFRALVERHESLRTVFITIDGEPKQRILTVEETAFKVVTEDFRSFEDGEARAFGLADAEENIPFDLTRGPLLRVRLIRFEDRKHLLLYTLHHIVGDAISMQILLSEMLTLYNVYGPGGEDPPPPLRIHYKDFTARQNRQLRSGGAERHKQYWLDRLGGNLPISVLPTDKKRPAIMSYRGDSISVHLDENFTGKLKELARSCDATLFMTLLAALDVFLFGYCARTDIVTGTAAVGRDHADLENQVGYYLNILPLRVRFNPEEPFTRLLQTARDVCLSAYLHQAYPFDKLVEDLGLQRETGMSPLFNVVLNMINFDPSQGETSPPLLPLKITPFEPGYHKTKFDLSVYVHERETTLTVEFEYSTDLFEKKTIRLMLNRFHRLLEHITDDPGASVSDMLLKEKIEFLPVTPLPPSTGIQEFKGSYHQQRLWLADEFEEGYLYESTHLYHNIPLILKLKGRPDREILEKSIRGVIRRHRALLTKIKTENNEPVQSISPDIPFQLPLHVLPPGEADEAKALELAVTESKLPFAHTMTPLIRGKLIQWGPRDFILAISLHHIIADRQSLEIFVRETALLYDALINNKTALLDDVPFHYSDFSEWQSEFSEDTLDKLLFYWKRKLHGKLRVLELPMDRPRAPIHTFSEGRQTFVLPGPLGRRIEAFNLEKAEKGTGNFQFFLTAFKVLLHIYCGQEEILVGTESRNPNAEGVIGPIANLVALRSFVSGTTSFTTLLSEVKQTLDEARRYGDMSFDKLVQELKPDIDMSRTALFDVLFRYEEDPLFCASMGDVEIEVMETNLGCGKYDLNLLVQRKNASFHCVLVYNTDYCDPPRMERFTGYYRVLLENILNDPFLPVSRLDIMTAAEKERLLNDLNGKPARYPRDMSIHRLVETRVQRTPDSIAVTGAYGTSITSIMSITYGLLNKKSGRLSRLLKAKGVTTGTVVAILADRSVEMIIGMIAILKSGGAYMPIDPDYPPDRVRFMLEDSGAPVLLGNSRNIDNRRFVALQERRHAESRVLKTAARPSILDFDGLGFPRRSLVDYEKYHRYIGLAMVKHSIALQATRGCPYKCAYCHNIWPRHHIVRSAENIFEEVRSYYNMGIRRFVIIDDIFNLDRKNSTRFFRLIIENGLKLQFFFPNGVRGDLLTEEYIDLMVEAGTTSLALALETASPRLQKLIGKFLNLDKLRKNIEYFCEKHPHVILELFTMHGFPTETEEEALKTLEFIKSSKWLHFPYVHILKIYPNTGMMKLAIENGVPEEVIAASTNLAYHELPGTLPFDKSFSIKFQADFLNNYFLSKERLLHVLPYQLKVMTRDEIVQKYNSYLPVDINRFSDLLKFTGITEEELNIDGYLDEGSFSVPGLNEKLGDYFPVPATDPPAEGTPLKVLLLDLSQYFSHETDMLYDVVEPPLGLMYLLTHLQDRLGGKVLGKIAKSRIDFDNYAEFKHLLEEFQPDVIGIRTLSFYKEFFHRAAAMIRHWGYTCPIVSGGPYASSDYASILQDPNLDLVVLGEGEVTFAHLISEIIKHDGQLPPGTVLSGIPGIAYVPAEERRDKSARGGREIIFPDEPGAYNTTNPVALGPADNPGSPAYIIYTSGTTGRPKGVMVEHRNLVSLLVGENFQFDFDGNDVWTMFHSPCFDFSVWEIFGALVYGGQTVLIPREIAMDTEQFLDWVTRYGVTVLNQTPSAFYRFADAALNREQGGAQDAQSLPRLRFIIFGGEALSPAKLKRWRTAHPRVRLINMFGITETTVHVTFKEIGDGEIEENLGNIGKPIPTLSAYVMDEYQRLRPVGTDGELYVGGGGVAGGYLNRPQLTAERFIENSHKKGEKLYRSGDRVRVLENGEMLYKGRIDQQVQLRGFRIELGEIETRLQKIAGIKEAVVIDREDGTGDKYLCAYIVNGGAPGPSELKTQLGRSLPDYMVPSFFIKINRVPLTPNGKIDRQALPAPVFGEVERQAGPDLDPVQQKLIDIWSGVLDIDKKSIDIDTGFFDLGGHSLKAAVLVSEVHKAFQVKLPLAEVFTRQTVRELGKFIEESKPGKYAGIGPVEKREYYALSSAQKRIYFLQRMEPGSTVYNMFFVTGLGKDIKKDGLETVLKRLIHRHESLRTSFHFIDDRPVQRVHETVEFELEYYGETGAFTRRPFDLSIAPLLRSGLIEHPGGDLTWLVDMHHIISDGISQAVLAADFTSLYRGEELEPLRLQYKDFAQWQNHSFETGVIKPQRDYWLSLYPDAGDIPRLELPGDHKRPKVFTFEGDDVHFKLERETADKFKALGSRYNATLYMNMLAALNTLFYRYTGLEDMIVGCAVSGRPHADLRGIVGMFINTLAMRNFPRGDRSYESFLEEVAARSVGAFDNQDFPFEELVDALELERDPSRNPLFDISMVVQNFQQSGSELFKGNGDTGKDKTSKFDMTFSIFETEEDIHFDVGYYTGIFREETVTRMSVHLKNIIERVSGNPAVKLKDIDLLTDAERNQLLFEFNDTTVVFPGERTIHELFEDQASQTSDRIAVNMSYRTYTTYMTYSELNRRSDGLARSLEEKGVRPGAVVGIMVERSPETIIGILATLKAGGAYLPIDPDYPEDRINYMLEDSCARLLLTRHSLAQKITAKMESIYFENHKSRSAAPPNPATRNPQLATSLSYILYTSGSTGRPKGVMVEHRNVIRLVKHSNFIDFREGDRLLLTGAMIFDITTLEIWGPLLNGPALYLSDKEMLLDVEKLEDTVVKADISILHLIPRLFHHVLEHAPGTFAGLNYFLVGGDLVRPEPVNRLRALYPGLKIVHCYGPTENTTFSTTLQVDRDYHDRLPIGKPITNSSVYILDRWGNLQPIGVPGELCTSGDGVARGYLNNPELTAEKFCLQRPGGFFEKPPPGPPKNVCLDKSFCGVQGRFFQKEPLAAGGSFYKTGDLARWLSCPAARGTYNIEFLGRIDSQVKINGIRIEPGEIREHLLNHEKITDAVIIAKENGEKYLCAYIVTKGTVTEAELRVHLSVNLPDTMIPRHFVQLDRLPLTPGGKIDRGALPEPAVTVSAGHEPPRNEIERKLVETWEVLLGRSPIGITDNFFALGGDSITSIQVAARMGKAGYRVEIKDIFQNQSIAKLAPLVTKKARRPDRSIISAIVSGTVPLTPIQERFLGGDLVGKHHFNHAVMLSSKTGFDGARVQKVFTAILRHHDALRMVYKRDETGTVVQFNREIEGKLFDLEVFYFENKDGAYIEKQVEMEANRIQQSIDLTRGPLVKLGLFKTPEEDHLLMVIHHLVVDGVSWRILLEDFSTGYTAAENGEEIAFPEKTDSFKHWAERLKESKELLKTSDYWKALEKEATQLKPLPHTGEMQETRDTAQVKISLEPGDTKNLLEKTNTAYNTEITDILLTALGLALHRWAGVDKVLIELEGHGREPLFHDVDINRTVGWFTALYPVILDINRPGDLSYMIRRTKETLRRIPGKGIGYGLNPLDIHPEIGFNYLGQFDRGTNTGPFQFSRLNTGENINPGLKQDHAIEINGIVVEKKLSMEFSYDGHRFEDARIRDLALGFKSFLLDTIRHCGKKKQKESTPSDVGYPGLSLEAFAGITEHIAAHVPGAPGIRSIYPLSPMQGGMLYHSLTGGTGDPYFVQCEFQLKGDIRPSLLEESFNRLIDRYDILRTVFYYETLEQPLQVVLESRSLTVRYEDLTGSAVEEEEIKEYIEGFKHDDRAKGFDLCKDLPMRLALFKTGSGRYVLLWSFHHIAMDGWCLGLIYNDLTDIYDTLKRGEPTRLKTPPSYKNYIDWLGKQDKDEGLRYWGHYLEGHEGETGLARLGRSKHGDNYTLEKHRLTLDEGRTLRLNRFAREHRVTVSTLFRAMWGILLRAYNNSDDVVFGAVVSGRSSEVEGIEGMVGLFINTVPVRIRTEGNPAFSQLVKDLGDEAVLSGAYEYLPLAEIQANSDLKTNLFDHLMVFENYPLHEKVENKETGIGYVEQLLVDEQTNYDFNISIIPGKEYSVVFAYNANVYTGETASRIGGHFLEVLDQVTTTPGIPVNDIEILTKEEKRQVLYDFNRTRADYPRDKTIHGLFEEQASQTPDRIAVNMSDRTYMTYSELNHRSDALAGFLGEKGVRPGAVVGIMVERSFEMLIGILGTLKAGGAYLPIDPDYPEDRINYMLEDSCARLLLTRHSLAQKITAKTESIYFENHKSRSAAPPNPATRNPQPATSLSYILYTSGSTGRPKGVMVNHDSVVNLLLDLFKRYPFTGKDAYLFKTHYLFDVSVTELFGWFIGGGRLAIMEKGGEKSPQKILDIIERESITHINFVPSMFNVFLEALDDGNSVKLSCLKYIFLAGEALLPGLVTRFRRPGLPVKLENLYGPTEATVYAAGYSLEDWQDGENIPIGKPLANVELYILNAHGGLQPVGVAGELCIGGAGVARGYLNNPELTAERFYRSYKSYRSYKTGDLARWLPYGTIQFLGRIDHQVKIRGYRIELGEIENLLLKHEVVKEAVVTARSEKNGDKYLCAYVAPASIHSIIPEIKQYLSQSLPAYMVPSFFVPIDFIPLTPGGKIDRNALPDPVPMDAGAVHTPPRNAMESKLAEIWADLFPHASLPVPSPIGIDDNFFELGGHSLKAIILTAKIHKALNVKIPLAELSKLPTIRTQSDYIKNAAKELYTRIEPTEKKEYYKISYNQQRLWYIHQMDPSNLSYNISGSIPLKQKMEKEVLEKVLAELTRRHESLRTRFLMVDGEPVQRVAESVEIPLKVIDLSRTAPGEEDRASVPFDLASAPLFRVSLVKSDRAQFTLHFTMHHIISDGWSMELLRRDFVRLFQGDSPGPLPLQYRDFAQWQYNRLNTPGFKENARRYWREKIEAGFSPLELPVDYVDYADEVDDEDGTGAGESAAYRFVIRGKPLETLRRLAAGNNTTLFTLLLSTLNMVMARVSGREDISIGILGAGRENLPVHDIVGFFVNTLLLETHVHYEENFTDFLHRVNRELLEMLQYQDYPLERAAEDLKMPFPTISLLFNMLEMDDTDGAGAGDEPGDPGPGFIDNVQAVKFDMVIEAAAFKSAVTIECRYRKAQFREETIRYMMERFIKVTDSIAADPGKRLKSYLFERKKKILVMGDKK